MTNQLPYRESHAATGYGERYDANYSSSYYAGIYREVETPILNEIFARLSTTRDSLLDFACGTGRITRLATPYFKTVTGVDVSEAMLANARKQVDATFIRQDITKQPLDGRFSVVTAFRFFLNAEEELRLQALAAIRNHLAPEGRLICNIHMNKRSIMGAIYYLAKWIPGVASHTTLSLQQFERTLKDSGFEIEQVIWYAVAPRPGHFFGRFLDRWVGPFDQLMDRFGLRGRFAHSFIVVARVAGVSRPDKQLI